MEGDVFTQYFICVEHQLVTEINDFKTSIFLLIAVHYIFNLSYNTKAHDFFLFLQEKMLCIQSDKYTKFKSPVGLAHANGISRIYDAIKN